MRIRTLTDAGINEFRNYINQLRQNSAVPRPDLNQQPFSEQFQPDIEVNVSPVFGSRFDIARYLDQKFRAAGVAREQVIERHDLWTYLAYLWFDLICPLDSSGIRKIGEDARYICSMDYTDYYRHLIAGAYNIYTWLGEKNSRLFLHSPVHVNNDFVEQLASRQFIIQHRGIIEAAHILYWDQTAETPKKGAQTRGKLGTLRRLVDMIQQFELTYDIFHMQPREVLNLLPEEFDRWRQF